MKKLWYVFIHVDGGAIVSDQRLTRVEANKFMDNSKVSMDFFELGLDYAFCQNVFVSCYGFEDEQEAKNNWDALHGGDSNPYEELPKMHIFTYDLGEMLNNKQLLRLLEKNKRKLR